MEVLRAGVGLAGALQRGKGVEEVPVLFAGFGHQGADLGGLALIVVAKTCKVREKLLPDRIHLFGRYLVPQVGQVQIESGYLRPLGGKRAFMDGVPAKLLPDAASERHHQAALLFLSRAGQQPPEVGVPQGGALQGG